ncbi:MAG: class I SAM-dependent methyltransferase [Roseburia sp.]|nr:class I SAM-dependent methyltransferase [Anaeroplasma bactoclasticum]MCM1196298.1 class I SAM-dependent methyltransferase [Roseburia sp.]MCM1557180.1 class I SAM-dependent methyltransferase [Anaeroplasma bactoclasticum]
MNEYKRFAYYYDDVYEELDYTLWLDFIKPYLNPSSSILDLACGSGTLAILLKLNHYSVEGLDLSESIIEIAKEKAKMNHLQIPFYVDDMATFNLDKAYDVITCFFDSVNFLKTKEDIQNLFSCVHKHLNPNGLFIFDIFSKTLLEEYKKHTYKKKYPTHSIKWKTHKIDSTILKHSILIKESNLKLEENYYEYYYDIKDFAFDGFEVLKISGDFKENLEDEDERILIVLKKVHKPI